MRDNWPRAGGFGSGELARPFEHRVQHRLRQLARERVLLRWVVRAEEREAPHPRLRTVGEARLRAWYALPELPRCPQRPVPRVGPEGDDHPRALEQPKLAHQVRQAVVTLGRRGPVRGWRAAVDCRDVGPAHAQAVIAVLRSRLAREPGTVQSGVKPVAGSIA